MGFFLFFYCFTYTTYNVILTLPTLIKILTLDTLLTLQYITVLNTTIAKNVFTQSFELIILLYLHHLNFSFSFFFIKHTRTQLHTCTRKIHSFMFGCFT